MHQNAYEEIFLVMDIIQQFYLPLNNVFFALRTSADWSSLSGDFIHY